VIDRPINLAKRVPTGRPATGACGCDGEGNESVTESKFVIHRRIATKTAATMPADQITVIAMSKNQHWTRGEARSPSSKMRIVRAGISRLLPSN
jgi:hypothetical protein